MSFSEVLGLNVKNVLAHNADSAKYILSNYFFCSWQLLSEHYRAGKKYQVSGDL